MWSFFLTKIIIHLALHKDSNQRPEIRNYRVVSPPVHQSVPISVPWIPLALLLVSHFCYFSGENAEGGDNADHGELEAQPEESGEAHPEGKLRNHAIEY